MHSSDVVIGRDISTEGGRYVYSDGVWVRTKDVWWIFELNMYIQRRETGPSYMLGVGALNRPEWGMLQ